MTKQYKPSKQLNKLREMIADVDCDDRSLNAQFYIFFILNEGEGFKCSVNGGTIYYRHESWETDVPNVLLHSFSRPHYTKSLDALYESIPNNFNCDINYAYKSNDYHVSIWKHTICFVSTKPTIYLALMDAVAQAIDYKRFMEKHNG